MRPATSGMTAVDAVPPTPAGRSRALRRGVSVLAVALSFCALSARAETVTYTYDALGRLISAATTGGHTTTYTYDANGNRTQVVVTGGTNAAPTAVTDARTTAFNTASSFDPRTNDSDANGDALTITAKTNGTNGTVVITGGGTGVTYTPTTGFSGSDSFTYTISDGSLTSVGTVNMTVSAAPSNTPPVAVDDYDYIDGIPPGVSQGGGPQTRSYYVKANDTDADGNSLTITSVSKVSGSSSSTASVSGSGSGTYLYVTGITIGTHIFDYVISDGAGGTDTGRLTIERVWEP